MLRDALTEGSVGIHDVSEGGKEILVIISHGDPQIVAASPNPGLLSHILVSTVPVVLEKTVVIDLAGLFQPGHGGAVDRIDVEEAVVVEIEHGHPGDHSLRLMLVGSA